MSRSLPGQAIPIILYLYAFMLPLFNPTQFGHAEFLWFFYFLGAIGSFTIWQSLRKTGFASFSLTTVSLAGIIICGLIGALLNYKSAGDLRFFFTILYLVLIGTIVNRHLTQEQVLNMFIFYGIGIILGLFIGGRNFSPRFSGNPIINGTTINVMPAFIMAVSYQAMQERKSWMARGGLIALCSVMLKLSILFESRMNAVLIFLLGIGGFGAPLIVSITPLVFFGALHGRLYTGQAPVTSKFLDMKNFFLDVSRRIGSVAAHPGIGAARVIGPVAAHPGIGAARVIGPVAAHPSLGAARVISLVAAHPSLGYRFEAVRAGLRMFSAHPFGVGFGNFSKFASLYVPGMIFGHPHNSYVELLVSTGVGGVLFGAVLLWCLFNNLKDNSFMQLMLFMLLLAGATDTLNYDKILLLIFASKSAWTSKSVSMNDIRHMTKSFVN
ncbi:MAG: O-antigen ligase family protein [Elusimicrobiota bacterium]